MDGRQIASVLVLRELGIEPKLDLFKDRLIVQKAIYLAQAAGVDLGYFYGWYLRGPYCSSVADDLFAAVEDPQAVEDAVDRWELDSEWRTKLDRFKTLIEPEDDELARRLELWASVHFLVTRKQVKDRSAKAIAALLEKFGKDFEEEEVEGAVERLEEAGTLGRS